MSARCLLAAALLLCATGASAQPKAKVFDRSYFLSLEEVEDLQIVEGRVKLNNFAFSEKPAMFKPGLFNFEVHLSARNRGEKPRNFTVMLAGVGSKEDGILWAINAQPPFYTVAPGTTAPVHGSVYVTKGTLKRTRKVWVRVVGNF